MFQYPVSVIDKDHHKDPRARYRLTGFADIHASSLASGRIVLLHADIVKTAGKFSNGPHRAYFATPIPFAVLKSVPVRRSANRAENRNVRSALFARVNTSLPRVPVRRNSASSSTSVKALIPNFSIFSRGINSCALFFTFTSFVVLASCHSRSVKSTASFQSWKAPRKVILR